MKKLLYPMLIAVLVLSSCGEATADSNDAKATLSACDCKKESEALVKEVFSAAMSGDESAIKDMEAKVKELEEDCKDYSEEDWKDCK